MGGHLREASLLESDDTARGPNEGLQSFKLIPASQNRGPEKHPRPGSRAVGAGIEAELGAMGLGDFPHEGQPQAPAVTLGSGNTVKPLAHPTALLFGNSGAVILDFEAGPAIAQR